MTALLDGTRRPMRVVAAVASNMVGNELDRLGRLLLAWCGKPHQRIANPNIDRDPFAPRALASPLEAPVHFLRSLTARTAMPAKEKKSLTAKSAVDAK
jgi:hypothetical protein